MFPIDLKKLGYLLALLLELDSLCPFVGSSLSCTDTSKSKLSNHTYSFRL